MRTSQYVIRSLAIAFAAVLIACGDSPTSPPPAGGGQSTPSLAVSRIEIAGPNDMAPNSTQQFRATAYYSDASSRDVTNEAVWFSSQFGIVTVTQGLATSGPTLGQTNIRASVSGAFDDLEVMVIPPGTFRVTGVVTESAANGYRVADARVEAATPTGAVSTTTLFNGEYRLYGVAGSTEIRVTKTGYQPLVRPVNVTEHNRIDLELGPEPTRPKLAGSYTLTITADEACRSQLPDDVMSRTYSAVITQSGPRLTVKLQGGTFANELSVVRDGFSGSVETGRPQFTLQDFYLDEVCFSGPSHDCFVVGDVVEDLGSGRFFNPTGKVAATESGSTISGALDGTIYVRGSQAGRYGVAASCKSSAHRFTLRK